MNSIGDGCAAAGPQPAGNGQADRFYLRACTLCNCERQADALIFMAGPAIGENPDVSE